MPLVAFYLVFFRGSCRPRVSAGCGRHVARLCRSRIACSEIKHVNLRLTIGNLLLKGRRALTIWIRRAVKNVHDHDDGKVVKQTLIFFSNLVYDRCTDDMAMT